MTNDTDNRRRAFADVVTIDAWHDSFAPEVGKVDLHADLVFGTARVGGELESPVRFRLSIRRAEIVVVIPESEPVRVDKRSVSRDAPDLEGRLTEVVERTTQASIKGSLGAALSEKAIEGGASLGVAGRAEKSASSKLEVSTTVHLTLVTQSQTPDGQYRWAARWWQYARRAPQCKNRGVCGGQLCQPS